MPKNKTLSFTATPELKDTIEKVARELQVSRSKAIVTLIGKATTVTPEDLSQVSQPSLRQLSLEKLVEMIVISDSLPHEGGYLLCDINEKSSEWFKDTQYLFETFWEPKIVRFLELADETNEVLWQVDNSTELKWAGYSDRHNDIYEIVEKLFEYGLVSRTDIVPATGHTLWRYYQDIDTGSPDDITGMIVHASREGRLDIVVSLCPYKDPVERGAYWKNYYSSLVGTGQADPWSWKGNHEASSICEEVTEVLTWQEPTYDVKQILKVLCERKDPFLDCGFFSGDFSDRGRYGSWQASAKGRVRTAFRSWYGEMIVEKGEDLVIRCLETVWGACRSTIQILLTKVINGSWFEILEVDEKASVEEIKKAHKGFARIYHPDINKSANAEVIMKAINEAKDRGLKAKTGRWTGNI